jgi:ABC-2 type transport system ATP-binding protein
VHAIPLDTAADQVREAIRRDVSAGCAALVDFATARAVTPRLKHEALLLRFNQRDATSSDEVKDLEQQMLDLVQRIQTDNAERWSAAAVAEQRQRVGEIQLHYLSQKPASTPAFVSKGLGKRYPGFHLRGVDLELRPGEVTAVVGQNANGKTTLLRIVAGDLRADEGAVQYPSLLAGSGLRWAEIKSQIAYLPQELPAWPGILRDNLHYEAALHGIVGQDNEREVAFFVERLGLREHWGKRWAQISGGYKLRFALARVLIWKPRLLVLDEPLANLDIVAQSRLLQDLLDLARSPRYPLAVLMSSQHLHELEAVASAIIFLRNGEVAFNGPMQEVGSDRSYNVYELGTSSSPEVLKDLFNDPRHGEPFHNGVSYVLKTGIDVEAATVLRKLVDSGINITYFRDVSRSIKSLFQ